MSDPLRAVGAFIFALTLLSYAGQAGATEPSVDGASNLIILAQDEENAEVQNELDPQSDEGQPGGPSSTGQATPQGGAGSQTQGGGSGALIEKELQEENQ
jgi:hypothetical protein